MVESADQTAIWIRYVRTARLFCFAIIERKLEGSFGAEASLWDFDLRRRARSTELDLSWHAEPTGSPHRRANSVPPTSA